jgi:hypothetical protein
MKEKFPKTSKGFEITYGADAAAWLKEQGITDYNGFGPKSVQAEASDFYMGKELKVSIKGYSSLPSLKEARASIAALSDPKSKKKALNGPTTLMKAAIDELDAFLASDVYAKAKDQDKVYEAWLKGQLDHAKGLVRDLMFELAQVKFTIVVGQIWPTEFASLDENTLDVTLGGVPISCKIEQKEIKVEI